MKIKKIREARLLCDQVESGRRRRRRNTTTTKPETADLDACKAYAMDLMEFESSCTTFIAMAVRAGAFADAEWLNWRTMLSYEPDIVQAARLFAHEAPPTYRSVEAVELEDTIGSWEDEGILIAAAQLLTDAVEKFVAEKQTTGTTQLKPAIGNDWVAKARSDTSAKQKLPPTTVPEAADILLRHLKQRGHWKSYEDAASIIRRGGKAGGPNVRTCSKATVWKAIYTEDERYQPLRDESEFKDRKTEGATAIDSATIRNLMGRLLSLERLPEEVRCALNGDEGESWLRKNRNRATSYLKAIEKADDTEE